MTRYLDRNKIITTKDIEFKCRHLCTLALTAKAFSRPDLKRGRNTPPVGNVKIALSEKIALLLHPHVDFPCSLVVS